MGDTVRHEIPAVAWPSNIGVAAPFDAEPRIFGMTEAQLIDDFNQLELSERAELRRRAEYLLGRLNSVELAKVVQMLEDGNF